MLSLIGRAAIKRIGAGASRTTTQSRAIRNIWCLHHVASSKYPNNASNRSPSTSTLRRSFATASKATKKPTSAKAKKPAAKKPASKKAAKKPAAKKPAKKAAAKPKKKTPVKKVLTPEQKEKKEAARAAIRTKEKLQRLKATALVESQPKLTTHKTGWIAFFQDQIEGHPPAERKVGVITVAAAEKFKALSPGEQEKWKDLAVKDNTTNKATITKWVESHTPQEIREANFARVKLNKLAKKQFKMIEDVRFPKRPANAFSHFAKERWATGVFEGISVVEANRILHADFKNLSPSEAKVYQDRSRLDGERYIQEFKTVFGEDPPVVKKEKA